MIKPQFFKHWDLYNAERESGLPLRLAFAGLWTVADRAGRFRWKVDIKTDVLPYDDVDMIKVLESLEQHGFVSRYAVGDKEYGLIPSFGDHQTFHKTERASTLPPPCFNGGSPVTPTSDTGTVTGTQLDVVEEESEAADEEHAPVTEPALTAMYLSIWANRAVSERWSEQPSPYTPAQCEAMADLLRNKGVEWQVARLSIYRQCREHKAAVPPRGPSYFRPGIETHWEQEQARRAVVASGEAPPPVASTTPVVGARREHWTDKKAREEREEGDRVLARARSGNVDQRRLEPGGERWWARMLVEAKAAHRHPTLYAFDRIHEPADAEAVHA